MRIDVVGKKIEITDAILKYAEDKAAKLPRYFDGVQKIQFTLTQEDHHKTGLFGAELVIDVEKHDDFVSHAKGPDLYAAIDEVVQKGVRQLSDFKERLKMGKR